jgi:hypothetical protein
MSASKKQKCPHCGVEVRQKIYQRHITTSCQKLPKRHPYDDIFPRNELPEWLRRVGEGKALPKRIPLKEILQDSCFYPASGLDASPVIILNGYVHSFVYVDYEMTPKQLYGEYAEGGFRGYRIIHQRDVTADELRPEGWVLEKKVSDGHARLNDSLSSFVEKTGLSEKIGAGNFFANWSVWRRSETLGDDHGPELFSMLFVEAEGVATFRALYETNEEAPLALAIIQPGHAFGGNYTNFFDPDGILWRTISAAGLKPSLLLAGQYGTSDQVKEPVSPYEYRGYELVRKTYTHEQGRQVYVYNSKGDTTRLLLLASMSEEEGFVWKTKWIPGNSHTIDIYKRTEVPKSVRK